MKYQIISLITFVAASPVASAQSETDTVCNSPLVLFGPIVDACEALGAELPDTDLLGVIGGSQAARKKLTYTIVGELEARNPEISPFLDTLEMRDDTATRPMALSAPYAPPAPSTTHPCDADPASFDCEYQRIVDDLDARFANDF